MRQKAKVNFKWVPPGIFFRFTLRSKAKEFAISGWIKKLRGNEMEAVFEGERDDIEILIDWCRDFIGGASEERIKVDWKSYDGSSSDFDIR